MGKELKISVVTVCYNMVDYIEQTITSVLSQGYKNLEYIIIDGGSNDGTQSIISKYRNQLSFYVSEPDNGMYDAINKGFSQATGDIIAWINADDSYFPWTFRVVNEIFSSFHDINWIGGRYAFLTETGVLSQVFSKSAIKSQNDIANGWCRRDVFGPLLQEGMFWRKSLLEKAGILDSSYKLAGDFELWMRFAKHSSLTAVDIPLAAFRRRKGGLSIGQTSKYDAEVNKAIQSKKKFPNCLWLWGHNSAVFRQILRLLTFRKERVIYYNPESDSISCKKFIGSVSSQCLESLRLYR